MSNALGAPRPDLISLALAVVERHEGFAPMPVKDAHGTYEVGFGTNFFTRGISRNEASVLALRDIAHARDQLQEYVWWTEIGPARQVALLDMAYCMGLEALELFHVMFCDLNAKDYAAAADRVVASRFASEDRVRAIEDATMIRTGEFLPEDSHD